MVIVEKVASECEGVESIAADAPLLAARLMLDMCDGACYLTSQWNVLEIPDTKICFQGQNMLAPTPILMKNWQHFDMSPICCRHVADIPS